MLHNVLETILFLGMLSMNELCYSMLWIGYYSTTRHVIHLFINPLVYRCTNSADYNLSRAWINFKGGNVYFTWSKYNFAIFKKSFTSGFIVVPTCKQAFTSRLVKRYVTFLTWCKGQCFPISKFHRCVMYCSALRCHCGATKLTVVRPTI